MRNLLCTGNHANLVKCPDLRRKTTVNTQDGSVHNGGEYEEIKDLTACFPYRGIAILLLALFIEAVYLSNLARLVVSTNQCDAIRVST